MPCHQKAAEPCSNKKAIPSSAAAADILKVLCYTAKNAFIIFHIEFIEILKSAYSYNVEY